MNCQKEPSRKRDGSFSYRFPGVSNPVTGPVKKGAVPIWDSSGSDRICNLLKDEDIRERQENR